MMKFVMATCRSREILFEHISDGTASTTITCFSPKAHDCVRDCNEVVNETKDKDTHHVPVQQVENTTPIFQYYFGKGARPGDPDFNLDIVFKPTTQPLLSLPAPQPTTPPSSDTLQQTTSTVRTMSIRMTQLLLSLKQSYQISATRHEQIRRVLSEGSSANCLDTIGASHENSIRTCHAMQILFFPSFEHMLIKASNEVQAAPV
ncbi:hypothetical protein Tco_1494546 [Tanacetum coccineum]